MEELHEKAIRYNPLIRPENIIFMMHYEPEKLNGFTRDERKIIDNWRNKQNELVKEFRGESVLDLNLELIVQDLIQNHTDKNNPILK